ncbi:hypothetical protein WMY93_015155 [Mugilogobius chulae]|uniref:Uncharacterized protein n=1 Tax=Mugilogobius chulae TaxID=88201 RepID=A0AAW0NWN4_9GOBI
MEDFSSSAVLALLSLIISEQRRSRYHSPDKNCSSLGSDWTSPRCFSFSWACSLFPWLQV